jgi:hypothetical protein
MKTSANPGDEQVGSIICWAAHYSLRDNLTRIDANDRVLSVAKGAGESVAEHGGRFRGQRRQSPWVAIVIADYECRCLPMAENIGKAGHVTTSDGVRLHYLEAGSGKPLVMIPGWSQTAASTSIK